MGLAREELHALCASLLKKQCHAGRTTTTRGNPWHSVTGSGRFRVHGVVFDGKTGAIRSRVLALDSRVLDRAEMSPASHLALQ